MAVALTAESNRALFVAPEIGGQLQFRVTVTDPMLHAASATVSVDVGPTGSHIFNGGVPPDGGFGLFVFSGGSSAEMVSASGCTTDSATYWGTDGAGNFVTYIPAASIGAVNEGWNALFPGRIPTGAALIGRCV
jgi:hypothetical protein